MKKRFICFAMALICLALTLTSCSDKLVMDGSGLTHKKTGITYSYVMDVCYQPVGYDKDPYTKWKYNDMKIEYYAVQGLEPTEWLYSPILGELLCSTGEVLPGIEGFGAETALICVEAVTPYSIYEIKDGAAVEQIIARLLDENTPSYSTILPTSNYTLKFESKKYPHFYYSMVLVADEDGVYIHDRMQGKYFDMGDLFDEYELYDGEYAYEG